MSEATFTFRVEEGLKNEFSTAAKSRDRTGAQLLRDFMRDFVKQQKRHLSTTFRLNGFVQDKKIGHSDFLVAKPVF